MRLTELLNHENGLNLSGGLVTLVVGILSVYTVINTAIWPIVAVLSLAQLIVFLFFISAWSPRSKAGLKKLLWLEAGLIVLLYFLVSISFIAILGIIWIVQAAELYPRRIASWLLVACVIVFAASQFFHWFGQDTLSAIVSSITLGLFHTFALSATRRAINERQLREETGALNRELIATRELLSQSTRQNERLRIARDLHDLLGHHMTALILNLEVANHCAEGKAQEKVEQALALAKLLLGDIRSAVSELREDDGFDLHQSVGKLVADVPGLEFEVDFSQASAVNDIDLAETLLRCTQEAVTNVLRHSSASNCRIAFTTDPKNCVLSITDNGQGSAEIKPGNGLTGMDERVKELGGSLSWRSLQDGFSLSVTLPMERAP